MLRNRSFSSMNHDEYVSIFPPRTPLFRPIKPEESPSELQLPECEMDLINEEDLNINDPFSPLPLQLK